MISVGCALKQSPAPSPAPKSTSAGTFAAGVATAVPQTPIPTPDSVAAGYLGDKACADCHAKEFRTHSRSPHARTLERVTAGTVSGDFSPTAKFHDQASGIDFRFYREGSAFFQEARQGANKMRGRLDLAMGTGVNARTYLFRPDPKLFVQLRVTWFTRDQKWDHTPLLEEPEANPTPVGSVLEGKEAQECLGCHVTTLRTDDEGSIDLEKSIFGVGCERCHGPGADHVRAVRAKSSDLAMPKLATISASDQNRMCGVCHRPQTREDDAPALLLTGAKFESASLTRSVCFQRSQGTLRCTTCHSPHDGVSKDALVYERACLSCHRPQTNSRICPKNPRTGCIPCHMPAQRVNRHFTPPTHWIRVYKEANPNSGPSSETGTPASR